MENAKLAKLYFLGARSYVQALTQLKYALSQIALMHDNKDPYGIFIHRYKQVEETDGKLEIFPFGTAAGEGRTRATLDIRLRDEPLKYRLVGVTGELVRVPEKAYFQEPYVQRSQTEVFTNVRGELDFWGILEEAVQLTKVFHIAKYNSANRQFRFVVGGFENLPCKRIGECENTEIGCRILKHTENDIGIYNYVKIVLKDVDGEISFLLPFIGIPKGEAL